VTPYLAPIEQPKSPTLRLAYWFTRRQFGKVPSWLSVFSARVPLAFTSFMGKVSRLDRRLDLPSDTMLLIRARVNGINACAWCMDATRWYAINKSPHSVPKLDGLQAYQSSALFDDKERAALDFATELTEQKHVSPDTFAALSRHYSEREICEISWIVASEHLYNINNIGLGIGSDGLCQIGQGPQSHAAQSSGSANSPGAQV
jgi:alkylhydroperoxidase family enzyme